LSLALTLASASFLLAVPQAQANPVWTAPSPIIYPDALLSFGNNANGRTGHGITAGSTLVPTHIEGTRDWTTISASSTHSLAINSAGELWAWGSNAFGQTGLGITTGNTLVPTQVGTASNWIAIAAGYRHSLALNSAGEIWAWGNNETGQTGVTGAPVGAGTGAHISVPTRVGTANNWVYISAGGTAHVSPAPTFMHGTSFAINSAGELWAWGSNSSGQTGVTGAPVGTGQHIPVPTRVGAASNWTTISVGFAHVLAVNSAGELWAWGSNGSGATGLNTISSNTLVPTRVGTASNWTVVSAASGPLPHSLAINSAGELWSWGTNSNGATGLNTAASNTLVPTRVGTASNWTAVSASGGWFSLALNSAGELWSWGNGGNGRTGHGNTENVLVPTRVGTYSNWTAIAVGSSHSLAIRTIIQPTEPDPFNLYKHLQKPEGTPAPNLNFRFTFERYSFNDESTPADIARIPVINPVIINPTIVVSPPPPPAGTVTLSGYFDFLDGIVFLEAGIYSWIIREDATHPSGAGPDSTVVFSQAEYELRVYVFREPGQSGDLYIRFITLHRIQNADGTTPPNGREKVGNLIFVNQYTYDPFITPTGLWLTGSSLYLVIFATGVTLTTYLSFRARKRIEELPIMH